MPDKPMRSCNKQLCPNLTRDVTGYCNEHKSLAQQSRTVDKEKARQYDKQRGSASSRGYDAKWRAYRTEYLQRNPKCVQCGNKATVVDHVIPHKGNKGLFWTRFNHQALCASCHSTKTVKHDGGFGNPLT